ncbi:lamin tail domain-containing protein [Parvicella tangerina]|uniref:LTD domain-containing protein n=1 Tax=Parvicella tangerina TaxID=2829795 RepID=A0A916N8J6_9FLAO|nr:lamin tail domain-containing protein [Parvicella tangerina]CAG5077156.1 hypothetical protein CRYO30217_00305 [Parvicella tangerina]
MLKVSRLYVLLFGLMIGSCSIFAQVNDDFSDGDFTTNPTWSGDVSLFTVTGGQLQSQSSGAATYYLSTPCTIATDAEWTYYFDFQFSTSGANYCDFYLMADNSDLNNVSNGYFVRMGGTNDEISLYKVVAGTETMIIDGADGLINSSSSNPFRVKVTRDVSDNWTLQYDDLGSSPTGGYVSGGFVNDGSITSSSHMGMLIEQSGAASPINAHFFDDIHADNIAPDVTPPTVTNVTVVSATELTVFFDEPLDVATAELASNYAANNGLAISSATVNGGNPAQVDLVFSTPFSQGVTNTLTVSNVEDLAGNSMTSSDHDFLYFVAVPAAYGDVLINEIFADPSPQYGLPSAEYIELYNASSSPFDLDGWVFSDASSSATLPSHVLMPGEVVAIADDDYVLDFSIFNNVIFVSSLPSLNNSSDDLALEDGSATLVDAVSYSDSWYRDGIKDDGGYSLELINPELPCSGAANWIASNSPDGGTPGEQNSVFDNSPDVTAPALISETVIDLNSLEVCFDESIDTAGVTISDFAMNNGNSIAAMNWSVDLTCVELTTSNNLDTGTIYTVTITGMKDCSGNSGVLTTEIVLPSAPVQGDLIINEVLFNPVTGGDDFVEIYNNSDKYIDLFGAFLANWDDGIIDNYKEIEEHRLMSPGDFVVLTKDSADIKTNFFSVGVGTFLEMSTLPTYANDSGTVYLVLPDSVISDQFSYDEDMHYPLIKDVDGVSLERIDFNRSTNDETNWHSAAENMGWGTPGLTNSQYYPGMITDDMVTLTPDVFSPDNDGVDDVLNISYALDAPGYVGNITIFDREGRVVKYVLQNELLSTDGIITWDGTNNNREKAPIGVYVVYFEVFDLNGNVSGVKKSTVVAGRF